MTDGGALSIINTANTLTILAVSLGITVAIGLLIGEGWPGFLMGAALVLSLWVILRFGSHPIRKNSRVSAPKYTVVAVAAMALRYLLYWIGGGGDNVALWVAGFVAVGMIALPGLGRAGMLPND